MYYSYSSVARCVIYLFLDMQLRVLNIIYGWVVMVSCTCTYLTSGVIVAINIISMMKKIGSLLFYNLAIK